MALGRAPGKTGGGVGSILPITLSGTFVGVNQPTPDADINIGTNITAMGFARAVTVGIPNSPLANAGFACGETGGGVGMLMFWSSTGVQAADIQTIGKNRALRLQASSLELQSWLGNANVLIGSASDDDAKLLIARGTATQTSGDAKALSITGSFSPASGTAKYEGIKVLYSIAQAGGANGAITGLLVNGTETTLVGTHTLCDFQVGGTSKFKVDNSGLESFGLAKIALGGGSAPTFGTIGGSGPAVAAQNSWVKTIRNGVTLYLPAWA